METVIEMLLKQQLYVTWRHTGIQFNKVLLSFKLDFLNKKSFINKSSNELLKLLR